MSGTVSALPSRPVKWRRGGEGWEGCLRYLGPETLSEEVMSEQRPEWSKGATRRPGGSETRAEEAPRVNALRGEGLGISVKGHK